MLSSSIQKQKFESIITHCHYRSLKSKKRRKRRKKLQINNNDSSAISTKLVKQKSLVKSKQYFQHDNRLRQRETEIKHTLFSSSCLSSFNKYTRESETLYNEVAKKFKPLNTTTKKKNVKKSARAFLKYYSQRKLKPVQKHKPNKCMSLKTNLRNCSSNTNINLSLANDYMKPRICSCPCQYQQKKCYNNVNTNSNELELQTSFISNTNNKVCSCLTSATTATTSSLTNCTNRMPIIENDLTKILEHLQYHAPTMFLETLINNAKLKNEKETKR